MPTTIAAMVIVMISNGMPSNPIAPSTMPAANILGAKVINASGSERNNNRNITRIAPKTAPSVSICDLKRLCSTLLYRTNIPVNWIRSGAKPSDPSRSSRTPCKNSSRRRSLLVSLTRTVTLTCSLSSEKYGDTMSSFKSSGKLFCTIANSTPPISCPIKFLTTANTVDSDRTLPVSGRESM